MGQTILSHYPDYRPVVSILMTTLNRADLIGRAIASVDGQTFDEWELIIVDDGSTDRTFERVNEHVMKDQRIRYVKHNNRKPALSLNVGLQVSVGQYITILGSDDEYLPEHLAIRVAYLRGHPHTDFIHGGVTIIGDQFVKDKNDMTKKIHLSQCAIGGTFFGKRDVFFDVNGFRNVQYIGDAEFLEKVSRRFNVEKVAYPTYVYHRETPGSITNTV
ncbi:MAG: glycosyltransferase family 2 protein [Patescibacteria group bacterium]